MSCEYITFSSYWEWDRKYFFEGKDLASRLISSKVDLAKRSCSENRANAIFTTDKEIGYFNVIVHEVFQILT